MALFAVLASACELTIEESLDGAVVSGDTLAVPVQVSPAETEQEQAFLAAPTMKADVNGVVGEFNRFGEAEVTVPLDPTRVFQPLDATAVLPNGPIATDRATVIRVDNQRTRWVADDELTPNSGALILTESALQKLSPALESSIAFDFSQLLPVGSEVYNEGGIAATLTGLQVDGYHIDDVGFSPGRANLSVRTGRLTADLRADIRLIPLLPLECGVRAVFDSIDVLGSYELAPDANDPQQVRAIQRSVDVTPGPSQVFFTSGLCGAPLIDIISQLLIPDLATVLSERGEEALADPDGGGPQRGPIEAAIEGALSEYKIGEAIAGTVGSQVFAPIRSFTTNDDATIVHADLRIVSNAIAANSPDLDGSLGYIEPERAPFPGSTTPSGRPYDLAVAASATGFNQILKALTEQGLLTIDLSRDPAGNPLTLNGLFAGAPCVLGPLCGLPVEFQVRPQFAPVFMPASGPDGEAATMEIGGLEVTTLLGGNPLLTVVTDTVVGLDLGLDGGVVAFTFGPNPETTFSITANPQELDSAVVGPLFEAVAPSLFPLIADAIGGFEVPVIPGIPATMFEVSRIGDHLYIFGEIQP